eukprot:scaffold1638_cov258-Pinguiococcus_pyrenoidosus.AAC.45
MPHQQQDSQLKAPQDILQIRDARRCPVAEVLAGEHDVPPELQRIRGRLSNFRHRAGGVRVAQRHPASPADFHGIVRNWRTALARVDHPRKGGAVVPAVVARPALLGHQEGKIVLLRQELRMGAQVHLDGRGGHLSMADVDVRDGLLGPLTSQRCPAYQ